MKKHILLTLLIISIIFSAGLKYSFAIDVKEYLEDRFPSIFVIYLGALEELDEYEKEFIDLLEKIPGTEQRVFAREVYENGFSIEILEKVKLKSQKKKIEKPFLKVAYPGQDGRVIRGNPIFVFGSTTPSPEVNVTVNGVSVEKFDYRTGNFLTLIEVPEGIEFPIKVIATIDEEETWLERTIIYQPLWKEMSAEPLAIHTANLQPRHDQMLKEGDVLRVIIQGSPSAQAVFRIGNNSNEIPMVELDPSTSSLKGRGIYLGSYVVKNEDILSIADTTPQIITVTLRRGDEQTSRELPGKIAFLSETSSYFIEVTNERTRFYNVMEDSFNLLSTSLGGDGWITQVVNFDLLPDTRFKITGRAGEYLKVKLGTENYLIHQDDVKEIKDVKENPYTIISKIALEETATETEIHFYNIKYIPFLIEEESQKIKVILFGVKQDDSLTINGQASSIEVVEINSFLPETSSNILEIDIKLEHLLTGFNYYWGDSGLVINVKKLPDIVKDNPLKDRLIVIDPGHGGNSPGAIGPGELHEKDVVLEISKYLQKLLEEKGARVVMTRSEDVNISLQKRTEIALELNADLFISIHANAHAEGADAINYHGHMTLYNYSHNKKLAEIILDSLSKKTGLPKTRVWERPDLAVLRQSRLPGILVETAFLMHPDDNWFLLQPEYQKELASGIMNGINDYFLNLIPSY